MPYYFIIIRIFSQDTLFTIRKKRCILLAVIILLGARSGLKHFKGEGGCCGGGSAEPPSKKKLKQVIATKTVTVEGMTCENCKNRVERCNNEIPGAAAKVNLKKKEVVVSLETEVNNEQIRAAIEKRGYEVMEIQCKNLTPTLDKEPK